jgi:hypothetical protein
MHEGFALEFYADFETGKNGKKFTQNSKRQKNLEENGKKLKIPMNNCLKFV